MKIIHHLVVTTPLVSIEITSTKVSSLVSLLLLIRHLFYFTFCSRNFLNLTDSENSMRMFISFYVLRGSNSKADLLTRFSRTNPIPFLYRYFYIGVAHHL